MVFLQAGSLRQTCGMLFVPSLLNSDTAGPFCVLLSGWHGTLAVVSVFGLVLVNIHSSCVTACLLSQKHLTPSTLALLCCSGNRCPFHCIVTFFSQSQFSILNKTRCILLTPLTLSSVSVFRRFRPKVVHSRPTLTQHGKCTVRALNCCSFASAALPACSGPYVLSCLEHRGGPLTCDGIDTAERATSENVLQTDCIERALFPCWFLDKQQI